jgi:hypothetical protein
MKGAWRLETADDPLHKLEHDFERMRTSPGDTCAAFDFFVTGRTPFQLDHTAMRWQHCLRAAQHDQGSC